MKQLEFVKSVGLCNHGTVYKVSHREINLPYRYILVWVSHTNQHIYIRYMKTLADDHPFRLIPDETYGHPQPMESWSNLMSIGLHAHGYQIVGEQTANICPAICSRCKSSNEYLSAPKDHVCTGCKLLDDWSK